MSSIYVAISSLDDSELLPTILDLYQKSSGEHKITVGLALYSESENFMDEVNILTNKYSYDIKTTFIKIYPGAASHTLGIGRGRKTALSHYSGEDYVMQIDSHALFTRNWDDMLVNIYNGAVERFGSKAMLTAYAGAYSYQNNRRSFGAAERSGKLMYPYFADTDRFWAIVPAWKLKEASEFGLSNRIFVPAQKFNANFVFATGDFALDNGLPDNTVFFEEEIVQTLELAKRGYVFVYPNIDFPIVGHLYSNHIDGIGGRKNILDYDEDPGAMISVGVSNYISYIYDSNNDDIVNRYNKYIGQGFDLRSHVKADLTSTPQTFII